MFFYTDKDGGNYFFGQDIGRNEAKMGFSGNRKTPFLLIYVARRII